MTATLVPKLRHQHGQRTPETYQLPLLPHEENPAIPLVVPDPITFAISDKYCDRRLYPRQATALKLIFLRLDLLTDYDREVVAEWEQSFAVTGKNGCVPGLLRRAEQLRAEGHHWFREVLLILGRRAGKGYISALAMAYVLWNYLAKGDPQDYYGIDRDKRLMCQIYAGKKEQARDNLWRDLVNIITGAPCFAPYISKPMGESLSVFTPADKAREGFRNTALDMASFRIDPLPAVPMSGRGGAACVVGFDEMAHMIAAGANRSSDEIWAATTPSLDQFGGDAFIVCPSSPWEMIGQLYVEWQHAQEVDAETGEFVYPNIFMLQLASWEIYYDWERAHQIELFPASVVEDPTSLYYRMLPGELPRLAPLKKAIQTYDEDMQRLERADPDAFSVERRSYWQTTLDAYLDPKKIAAMFEGERQMRTRGILSNFYKAHADPGFINDPFGLAIGHVEAGEDGYDHVVFDYLHHWDPADYPDHTVDYLQVTDDLWELVYGFPLDDLSFDQHNSQGLQVELNRRVRGAQIPKRVQIGIINETAKYNLMIAENFKVALNQGWVHAPFHEQADLELRFLQFKNNRVVHQTTGPVQHDDIARSMMEVVFALLEKQVVAFKMGHTPLSASMHHGVKPWMHGDVEHERLIAQFSQVRRGRTGRGAYSPARGIPAGMGRPSLPRQGRFPGYTGR